MSYSQHKGNKPLGVPSQFQPQQIHRQQQPLRSQTQQQQLRSDQEHPRVAHTQQVFHQPPRHPSPVPVPSPGIPAGASPSPSSSPGVASNSQGLASGTAHDMSKQGAPSHPGLAPSPHQPGNVVPSQQQQQQQQPQPQPHGVIPQQSYTLIPQRPVFMQRINNQTSRGGMIQIQPAPSSGPQQMAGGGQMNPQYMPSNQPFMMMSMNMPQQYQQQQRDQPVYSGTGQYQGQSQTQQQFQQRQVYQPQQYTGQSAQQAQMYTQPSTPPYYTNMTNSPPVSIQGGAQFFPGSNQAGMVVPQQQLRQNYPVLPTAPQYSAPKKKNIIRIVDPKSNQDITDSIIREAAKTGRSSPHSGQSSASETPPASQTPPQNYQADEKKAAIQASFAAQVARLAHDSPTATTAPEPHFPEMVPASAPPQQPLAPPQQPLAPQAGLSQEPVAPTPAPDVVAAAAAASVETPKEGEAKPDFTDGATTASPDLVEPSVEGSQAAPAVTLPKATDPAVSVQPEPPAEVSSKETSDTAAVNPTSATTNVSPPVQAQSVPSPSPPPPSTDAVDMRTDMPPPSVIPPKRAEPAPEPSDSHKDAPKSDEVLPPQENATEPEPEPPAKIELEVQQPSEDAEPAATDAKTEESSVPKEPKVDEETITTKQVANEESVVPAKQEDNKESAVAKEPSKKKSQKNRFKDLDKKPPKDEDVFEAYRSTENKVENNSVEKESEAESTPDPVESPEAETVTTTPDDAQPSPPPEKAPEEPPQVAEQQEIVVVVDEETKQEQEKVETENAKNKEEAEDTDPKESLKDNKIQLKYTYRDDQWSPMNPEGKKQYGRDFLLQFQSDCKEKPEGLPHIPDIVLDKADVRPPSFDPPGRINNRGVDFTPSYLKSPRSSQQPPQFGPGVPSGGGRRSSKEPKKVIQRVAQTVKLNTAGENAWKPDKDVPLEDEESKTKDLFKKMKSLLNKLTPNNFQKLKSKAMAFPIDTEERLKGVIDLVFEKAVNESSFSKTYAELCRDLSQLKVQATTGGQVVQFRTLLINRCQKEFEKEKTDQQEEQIEREKIATLPPDRRTLALEDLQIKLIKNKQRILGNMRFIGELFKLQMLIEQIMHDCIFKLLCSKDEESLECMVHLLITIGKILDHEKAKNRMDQYFNQIKNLNTNKKSSTRIRFLLQDVMDLRTRNWVPRRANDNPKTIDQIRQDFKREEEQKKIEGMQAQMAAPPPRIARNRRDPPQRVGPPQPEAWSTVAPAKASRVSVDPSKFKLSKPQSIDDEIQLGPGRTNFGGWSRGSSGGSSKTQASQEPPEPRQSNRFMMLSDERRGRGPTAAEARGRGPLGGKRSSGSRERDQSNRERQMAIAEVQRISGARRSHSREKDRDLETRRGRTEPSPAPVPSKDQAKVAPAVSQLSEEVFEKKATATIDEYLHIKDTTEAITCISELRSPDLMHVLVRTAMNVSLEKSAAARDNVGSLFHKLIKAGHLTKEKFVEGLKEVLLYAEDMALDIPMIWKYLGEVIGATYRDNTLPLSLLADPMEPIKAALKAGDVMADILLTAVKLNGASVVAEMWQSSGFTWDMFLPSGQDVNDFVNNKKLEFTLTAASSSTTNSGGDASANNVVSDEEWSSQIRHNLGAILASSDNVNSNVFDWVQKNLNISSSPDRQRVFIRALVTVVVQSTIQGEAESCRMNHDLLAVRTAILKRYINNDNVLELQALYAVQALNQHLENPPRLLGLIFNVLYDEDVIPEETFYAWQKCKDPNENHGKGVALKSVTSFFAWLREADEEPAK